MINKLRIDNGRRRTKKNNYNDANQSSTPAEALKDYVFALADGLLVTIRATSEYEAGHSARQEYICC